MTKVILNPIETPPKPVIHRMGNFYESGGEVFILANVDNENDFSGPYYMCLISLVSANRFVNPIAVPDRGYISEENFNKMCGNNKIFRLIETITVNFSK